MSTIDEAMAQALAAEESANDDWVKDERYSTKEYYSDTDVSIDMERRTIGDISENVSTVGENNAQYISFMMDRYIDGVDLKNMTIQIQAEVSENVSAIDGPVNVYYNESKIRFGWAISSNVAQQAATIEIIVFCTGALPDGNSYTIKTLPLRYTINDTLNIGGSIPQPDENWYLQFVTTMDEKVTAAANSASAARESAIEANESLAAIQVIQSDINQSKSTVQTLAAQVQSDTTKAQTSADAAKTSEQNAQEWFEKTKEHSGVSYASKELAGIVKPQDIYVDQTDGSMTMITHTDSPTLYNSYAGGIKLNELGGASEQDSTTGYNLLDCRGLVEQTVGNVTFTPVYDANGNLEYVEANGTSSTLSEYHLRSNYSLPNGTYILSGAIASNKKIFVNYGSIWATDVGNGVKFGITDSSKLSVVIQIETGVTCDNIRFYPMIRLASVTDATYEPYTGGQPSPNPEYPQEINSVEVSGFWGHGKNWCHILETDYGYVEPDAKYTHIVQYRYIKVFLKAGTYTISEQGTTDKFLKLLRIVSDDYYYGGVTTITNGSYTFYHEKDGEVYFSFGRATTFGGTSVDDTFTEDELLEYVIQINESYFIILSNPIKLNGVGTSQDKFVRKDGVWKIERNVPEVVFDGSDDEAWIKHTGTTANNLFYINVDNLKSLTDSNAKSSIMCSHFISSDYNSLFNTSKVGIGQNALTLIAIGLGIDSEIDTVEKLKAHLAENPITVQYEVAQPTYEDLPTADQIALNSLVSYDGITYLYCDSEVQPTWDLEYGTSKVGALVLECYNDKEVMKLEIAAMKTAQTTTEEVTEE